MDGIFIRIIFVLSLWARIVIAKEESWKEKINLLTNKEFVSGKLDIVFLLDRSGSIGFSDFEVEKGFVDNIIRHLPVSPNSTRVAVISYSVDVVTHIDYLKNPKSKCFLGEELRDIEYVDSSATDISAALYRALKVFENARPDARKVAILLTDGRRTHGEDPAIPAKNLHENGIDIFVFGIGRVSRSELLNITSETYIFHCSDFKEFEQLSRAFRGDTHETTWSLHDDPRACDSQCDGYYTVSEHSTGCCDHAAKCSCSLKTGRRDCICGPGYYGDRGIIGECKPCPVGSYKETYENNRCRRCPEHSTTKHRGASSIKDCKCETGYEGFPCKLKKCPILQEPTNGYIIDHCDNTYNSSCFFCCNKGYELQKDDSRERICQDSKEWSGSTAVCREITCPEPVAPIFGKKTCNSTVFTIGTVCNYSCDSGYMLKGKETHKCAENKNWIPGNVICQPITCPSLNPTKHLMIHNCDFKKHYYLDDACIFHCPSGFKMIGPSAMVCNKNKQWIGAKGEVNQPICQDIEPPEIECPPSIILSTDKGEKYASFKWPKPRTSDNSGYQPLLSWSPQLKQPAKFYIGSHEIKFKATDKEKLTSSCRTSIVVEDKEPPRIKYCPNNIEVNTSDFEIAVSWKKPEFFDNSLEFDVTMTAISGSKFSPGKHTVTYMAKDKSNNIAICSFNVIVSKTTCPYHPPPVNGAIACSYWINGEFCEVYCNEKFEFTSMQADYYICDTTNEWKTIPFDYSIPWPDCAEWRVPNRVKRTLRDHYFIGDCQDPDVQQKIKEAFKLHIHEKFNTTNFCTTKGICLLDSIKVACGKTNYTIPMRAKRDVWHVPIDDIIEIEVEIMVSNENSNVADLDELVAAINEIVQNMKDNKEKPIFDGVDPNVMLQDSLSVDVDEPVFICYVGAVLRDKECVNCAVGSYHDRNKDICKECPVGYYQDEEASTECIACPNGTWTETTGSKNSTDCKQICLPGTYSLTGLATCEACPLGTYQPLLQQTYCISCPENATTAIEGAEIEYDCLEACAPGTYSETGLSPCMPCSLGMFQQHYGQLYCETCPGNLTTINISSNTEEACIDYDHCSSKPCLNYGDCISDQYHFYCVCQEGFAGKLCEENVDDCLYADCAQGSTCIDAVATYFCQCPPGYTGTICDEEIDECESMPCQNYGICVDEVNNFQCLCMTGYEGQFCEIDIDMCQRYPCTNEAHCEEIDNSRLCTCQPGFEGEDCSINIDDCLPSLCQNGGSCVDGILNYTCSCIPGFIGSHCEINIDECVTNRCQNEATCRDGINSYTCHCQPGFSGIYCEHKLSPNFMMSFDKPLTSNYAIVNNLPPMSSTSVGMWVQTRDQQNQGAMISYAANNQFHQEIPNALTVTDYGSLKIYINDRPIYTGLKLNDGKWHHIAFTWSSKNGGWKLYHNGSVLATGDGFETGEIIPGGGSLIVGQEQDCVGGDFSSIEAFTGNISRVNIWNKVLSQQDINQICHFKEIPGIVAAWPDFQSGINGNIRITNSDMVWE